VIALVTGANKGIGREISRQLATKNVLVIMGSNRERGEKAVADLRAHGLPVEFVQLDVTVQSSVDHAAMEVERRHGLSATTVRNRGERP
jgi:NAD(P)-dependent dehydrogenase (short-subunit alcohol dehydrogenase family)